MEKSTQAQEWREDCWARFFSFLREYNLQRLQSKQEESTERGGDVAAAKDVYHEISHIKKIRSKERKDAKNRWFVSDLLAEDCEKSMDTHRMGRCMHTWYKWLEYMKKEDEKEKMEEMHRRKVEKMIKSAEGSAGLLSTRGEEYRSWRKRRKTRGCQIVVRRRGKSGQSIGNVTRKYRI